MKNRIGMSGIEKEVVVLIGIIIIDQATKLLTRKIGVAQMNTGGVLGILPNWCWVIAGGPTIFFIGWKWMKKKGNQHFRLGMVMLLGAGGSNLMDRLIWGGVWDFISYPVINVTGNVADILLGVGVLLLLVAQKSAEQSR